MVWQNQVHSPADGMKMARFGLNRVRLPQLAQQQQPSTESQPYRAQRLSQSQRMAILRRHRKDRFDECHVETDSFQTTNQMFHENKGVSPRGQFNKHKTDFSHYYNACMNSTVYFNTPVNGL